MNPLQILHFMETAGIEPACRSRREGDAEEIPRPPETWPIIEHEPERLPVVPPDWEPPVPDRMLRINQGRQEMR